MFNEIILLSFYLIISNHLRTFDFAVITKVRADTSTDLVSERDYVVIRSEQRCKDRRIGTVESVAVILRPNIQRRFTIPFQDTADVLEIFSATQNFHALRHDGPVFLIKIFVIVINIIQRVINSYDFL